MLFSTLPQLIVLVILFFGGLILGLGLHPGGKKWRERFDDESENYAQYRRDADMQMREANKRIGELERDAATLQDREARARRAQADAERALAEAELNAREAEAKRTVPDVEPEAPLPGDDLPADQISAIGSAADASETHKPEPTPIRTGFAVPIAAAAAAAPTFFSPPSPPAPSPLPPPPADTAPPAAPERPAETRWQPTRYIELNPEPTRRAEGTRPKAPPIAPTEPEPVRQIDVDEVPAERFEPVPEREPEKAIEPDPPEEPRKSWFSMGGTPDLGRIRGIDPTLKNRLFGLGVTNYEDIISLSPEDEMALEQRLQVPAGYITREQWRDQAALLRAGKSDEQADRFPPR